MILFMFKIRFYYYNSTIDILLEKKENIIYEICITWKSWFLDIN